MKKLMRPASIPHGLSVLCVSGFCSILHSQQKVCEVEVELERGELILARLHQVAVSHVAQSRLPFKVHVQGVWRRHEDIQGQMGVRG